MENECYRYLAVQFDDEDHPVFGKLRGIFELNICFIVFDVICLETVEFDETLEAFQVHLQASGLTSVTPDMLITHAPLVIHTYHGSSYIKLKGSISALKDR